MSKISGWTPTPGLALSALFLLLGACSETTTSGGRTTSIEISADRSSAPVGDSIEFFAAAEGSFLAGMAIDFGDGVADSIAADGAVTATMRRKHAYQEPGTYWAVGIVADGTTAGLIELRDSVSVQVTGGF